MLDVVVILRQAQRDLRKVPTHVAIKFQDWVEDVEDRGLAALLKGAKCPAITTNRWRED